MGKKLVIHDADFYSNALERATPVWDDITSRFSSWSSGAYGAVSGNVESSGVFQHTNKVDISDCAGKEIRFLRVAWTSSAGAATGWGICVWDANGNVIQSLEMPKSGTSGSGYSFEYTLLLDYQARLIGFTYFNDAKKAQLSEKDFYCFARL